MTDQPKFPSGSRVQLTLHGEVCRAYPVTGEWKYTVQIDGVQPAAKRVTCGERAITADDGFDEDNSGHDTDCDCKACLIDAWHAEVDELRAEVNRLRAEGAA